MLRSVLSRAILAMAMIVSVFGVSRATNVVLTHQGRLLDAADAPVTGSRTMTFRIYDALSGGAALWTEVRPSVAVVNGLFDITLGTVSPLEVDVLSPSGALPDRWLGVTIDGVELLPRMALGSVPRAAASTRVTGDIATSSGAVTCSQSDAGGTGTVAIQTAPDSAVTVLKSEGPGPAPTGQTNFTVTARFEDRTSSDMTYDSDGDGIPESSVQQESRPGGATMKAIQTKGTGAIASVKMEASDTTGIIAVSDLDGDGNPEARASTFIVEEIEFVVEKVERASMIDPNDDGIPESAIEETCSMGGTTMKAIQTKGTGAIASVRMEASDSTGIIAVSDLDGDGNPEASMRGTLTGVAPGSSNRSAQYLDVDDNDDGVPESSLQMESRPGGVTMKAIQTKGTGAIASVRMDAGDSANTSVETDADGDGNPEASCLTQVHSTGIGFVDIRTSVDSNDDGTSDYSSESHVGSVSVAYKLLDSSGDPASIDFTIGNDRPQITVTQVGIDRCIVSPDSGIQLSNPSAVKTVDLHDSGILYLASGIEIGMTGGTHHIDVAGGAYCDGTNWVNASDKNAKENFHEVNGEELLKKISELEITKWNYKSDKQTEHIGPTAQDFKETFGVGSDGKSISTIDPSGIALAAIKELYAQLKSKDKELAELRAEMAKMKKEIAKKN